MLPALIASIVGLVGKAIDKAVPDAAQAAELKDKITGAVYALAQTELQGAIAIILAEVQGESWLQRNWRPLLMLTCIAIIANNYVLYPYLKLFFAAAPLLELPDALWELLKIGVGGYVVGRSVEKGIDLWRNGASSEARGAK
jgi:Na+-transporting methylmalonyl-CoA/oxaloacetate decarboxylase gamma subunit